MAPVLRGPIYASLVSPMFGNLQAKVQRSSELELLMSQPETASDPERLSKLAKEHADLQPLVLSYRRYEELQTQLDEARQIAAGDDPEMAAMAADEATHLQQEVSVLEQELQTALLPVDPNDAKNVIVEVRAGTGGDEAALFAADLYRAYLRYAQRRSWRVDLISSSESGVNGVKEVVFEVQGSGAYRYLKHESGVHRVQRVPATEAQGRIHTSTATVAVLPEAEEVDVRIRPEDLRIDIFHAGGAGGQNVNKVATAVRITHLPTGIVAVCQDERSQLRNKNKAMSVVRSRLLERETLQQQQETSSNRRAQVGTGERSEKVRTYNFPQDRVTDHRIGLTLHGLENILDGALDPIFEALLAGERDRLLQGAVA